MVDGVRTRVAHDCTPKPTNSAESLNGSFWFGHMMLIGLEQTSQASSESMTSEDTSFSQKHLRCLGSRLVTLAAGERD